MEKPTVKGLVENLKDLVRGWKTFAILLPKIEQPDIDTIESDRRDDTVDQKQRLYDKWLRVYPEASWEDVIVALEKAKENKIAKSLREKFHITETAMSPKQPEGLRELSEISSETCDTVPVADNVVKELDHLYSNFLSLTELVRKGMKRKATRSPDCLDEFVQRVKDIKPTIEFPSSVKDTNQFFEAIRPHCNFLDPFIVVNLAQKLGGLSAKQAKLYICQTEDFMKRTEIKDLHNKLKPYCGNFGSSKAVVRVEISVQNAMGTQSVFLVQQLIRTLFFLKLSDQLLWLEVVRGCLHVVLLAPVQMKIGLIESSRKKLQFMRLTGIIRLLIDDLPVLAEEEDEYFSFERNLKQAIVDNNTEAVQLLQMCLQFNAQINQLSLAEGSQLPLKNVGILEKETKLESGIEEKKVEAVKLNQPTHLRDDLFSTQKTEPLVSANYKFEAYLPQLCGCGKCAIIRWRSEISGQNIGSSQFSSLLTTDPKHVTTSFFKDEYDRHTSICIATSGLINQFQLVVGDIWNHLGTSVQENSLVIFSIANALSNEFEIQLPIFPDLDSIQNYFHLLRVSWYNFRFLHLLVSQVMPKSNQNLLADWKSYLAGFEQYCSIHTLHDFSSVFFRVEEQNIFILEVDVFTSKYKLPDIYRIFNSLSKVLGFSSVYLNLLAVRAEMLLAYIHYCYSDYLTVFKSITPEQLRKISQIKDYRILSIADLHCRFRYENIQNIKDQPIKSTKASEPAQHDGISSGTHDASLEVESEKELKHESHQEEVEMWRKQSIMKNVEIENCKEEISELKVKLREKENELRKKVETNEEEIFKLEVRLKDKIEEENELKKQIKTNEAQCSSWRREVLDLKQNMEKRVSTLPFYFNDIQYPSIITVITNFSEKLKQKYIWFSPGFYSNPRGYKMCLKVCASGQEEGEGTHVSIYVHLMSGEYDDFLAWPFRGKIHLQLLNRQADDNHISGVATFDESTDETACGRVFNGLLIDSGIANTGEEGIAKFVSHEQLQHDPKAETVHLYDDSLFLKVKAVEIDESSKSVAGTPAVPDKSFLEEFTMKDFSKFKSKNSTWTSEPFFTHKNGYKFVLVVHPNGTYNYKGKSVSIFAHLMKGEYDGTLNFPFRGRIYVQIVNQTGKIDRNHVELRIDFNKENDPNERRGARVYTLSLDHLIAGHSTEGWGYDNFISHNLMYYNRYRGTKYLSDNDEIVFRVSKIEVFSMK